VHRTEAIMLRSVLVLYIPPIDAKMLAWRSGRAAAAGVAAVLPDEVPSQKYIAIHMLHKTPFNCV